MQSADDKIISKSLSPFADVIQNGNEKLSDDIGTAFEVELTDFDPPNEQDAAEHIDRMEIMVDGQTVSASVESSKKRKCFSDNFIEMKRVNITPESEANLIGLIVDMVATSDLSSENQSELNDSNATSEIASVSIGKQ